MLKTKYLRGFMRGPVFDYLKKTKISPEFLTSFRIIFALITGVVLFFGNYFLSLVFIIVVQFVFLLDYVDGPLARYKKRFSKKWQKADMIFHYITAALFLYAITTSYYRGSSNILLLTLGIVGTFTILYTLLISLTWYGKLGMPLTEKDKKKAKRENKSIITKFYSFLGIDSPFSLFFIFVVLDILAVAVIFYSILKIAIFIKKVLYLQRWQRAKRK